MERETIEYKGYTINTFYDELHDSPRDWDNLGTMICFHGGYNLGDKTDLKSEDFNGWDELENYLRKELQAVICLPLYFYDHSMQSISTVSFLGRAHHADWDSGRVGFIYATQEDIKKNWDVKRISKKRIADTERILRSETETYDEYIRGNVFGFTVEDAEGNNIDSCGGYLGDDYYDEMVNEAKSTIDYTIKELKKELSAGVTLG